MDAFFSRQTLLILGIALLCIAAGGGSALWLKKRSHAPAVTQAKDPVFVELEPLTVNLQSENGDHMFHMRCSVQLTSPSQEDLLKLYMPEVLNRLILTMSEKKPSDVANDEGQKRLRDEMLTELQKPFRSSGARLDVKALFFTTFVVE